MATAANPQARAQLEAQGLQYSPEDFLLQVARGKVAEVALFLAAGMSPEVKNGADEPVLLIAAKNGHHELVDELHRAGASLAPLVNSVSQARGERGIVAKIASLAPLGTVITTVVIAAIGWHFTNTYNDRQSAMQANENQRSTDLREMEVVQKMFPSLVDSTTREGALGVIRVLARQETASSLLPGAKWRFLRS